LLRREIWRRGRGPTSKLAATVERRTIKGFLLALAEERIQELERKGLLPKGKG